MAWINRNGTYVDTLRNERLSDKIHQYSLPGNNGLTRF